MKKSFLMAVVALVSCFSFGCVEDATEPMSLSGGSAGAAGSGGSAGSAGNGGCYPEGLERSCECPDGTEGTQECLDGEFVDCVCFYYPDRDNDDHGDVDGNPVPGNTPPAGTVGNKDDCDDDSDTTYPGAAEHESSTACMNDDDGDGYGDNDPPAGVTPGRDCNDDDKDVHPGADELCDGKDNDCDGHVDEGCVEDEVCNNNVDDDNDGLVDCADPDCANDVNCGGEEYTHWHDGDGDGYTDGASITDKNPNAPSGYTNDPESGIDCNDDDNEVYPGAPELCDGKDNNCNGVKDEGCLTDEVCNNNVDDDNDGLVDCADPDCDNAANCGGNEYTHYRDGDGDGYTKLGEYITDSNPNAPPGYTNTQSSKPDCDDTRASVHPNANEVCNNGLDDNCNGQIDEGCVTNEVCNNNVDDDNDGLVDCADPECANASNCVDTCTNGATQSCSCGTGETGSQTCVGGDWTVCICDGGTVTLKYEVDCSAQLWTLSPQPEGSWAGRAYGPLTGCVSTGTRKTACTFDIPAPDYPTFVGQGFVGFGRYAGDGSGNAPAPCVTPAEVDAMQGTSLTLLCTVRLWKDGVPVSQRWESNGVMKPSGTQSCTASGSFPYYNSRPVVQNTMSGEFYVEALTQDQMLGARFEVVGNTFYWMGGNSLEAGWRSLESLEPNDIIWLGSRNTYVKRYFPSLFTAE